MGETMTFFVTQRIAAILVLCMVAAPAAAYFDESDTDTMPVRALSGYTDAGLIQVGEGAPERRCGRGSGIPLSIAATMIMPEGWTFSGQGDTAAKPVSWNSGKRCEPWVMLLAKIARKNRMAVLVDWNKKAVFAEPSDATDGRPALRHSAKAGGLGAGGSRWRLAPGGLKAQMTAWAGQAGYQIVWQPNKDYLVDTAAEISGSYIKALRVVFEALRANDVRLAAEVYSANRVVHVKAY